MEDNNQVKEDQISEDDNQVKEEISQDNNQVKEEISQDNNQIKEEERHFYLATASAILGIISLPCCLFYGIGIIFALIGTIFALISAIKGQGKRVKRWAAIGLISGILGLSLNIIFLASLFAMIRWENFNPQNIEKLNSIDPNNKEAVVEWMQQFFKIDINKTLY